MEFKTDPIKSAGMVNREIRTGTREGDPTKIAIARRLYRADRSDVWDAITNPERIPRWFLPVSGDLSVGGHYQFEGHAGGTVESCKKPESLSVTWEFGGQVSWLEVSLSETEGGTTLELVHEAPVDPAMWDQFGAGAVGIGWDSGLLGLDMHLATRASVDPEEAQAWMLSPEGVRFARLSADGWAQAAIDDGEDPEKARAGADASVAAYTTLPEGE